MGEALVVRLMGGVSVVVCSLLSMYFSVCVCVCVCVCGREREIFNNCVLEKYLFKIVSVPVRTLIVKSFLECFECMHTR